MTTKAYGFEDVCHICHAPLDSQSTTSELCGGVVCAECTKIERTDFVWWGNGSIIIVSVWMIIFVFYRYGLVSRAVHDFVSLWWGVLWGLACLLGILLGIKRTP
jgi:hypothetical protein